MRVSVFEISGVDFEKVDKACHVNFTAAVAVTSACSVPMDILNNIKRICYEISDQWQYGEKRPHSPCHCRMGLL